MSLLRSTIMDEILCASLVADRIVSLKGSASCMEAAIASTPNAIVRSCRFKPETVCQNPQKLDIKLILSAGYLY